MRELYRHKEFSTVAYYKSLLEAEGISVLLRNETLQMSGLSEIPIPEFYPNICVMNDEDYEKEKNFYDKYISQVINQKDAEELGYFWVVTEAKVIEGSAVPMGSNPITPTTNIDKEPSFLDLLGKIDTQEKAAESTFSIIDAINKNNFLI